MREVLDRRRKFGIVPSGSTSIDELLGGGYPVSQVVEIYGESKTGKTQLALQAALVAALKGYDVLYVDTEGTFRPERIDSMGKARGLDSGDALSRIFCVRATDTTTQLGTLNLLGEKRELHNCRMIVVDTLTKNFGLEYPGRTNAPKRQGLLSVYLSNLGRDAFLGRRAVLLTNRVTVVQLGPGSREAHVGGKTVKQMVNLAIHLTRMGSSVRAALVADDVETKVAEGVIDARGFN